MPHSSWRARRAQAAQQGKAGFVSSIATGTAGVMAEEVGTPSATGAVRAHSESIWGVRQPSCPSGLTPGVSLCPPTAQAVAALPGAVDEALSILTFLLDSCVQNGLVQEVDLQRMEQSGREAAHLMDVRARSSGAARPLQKGGPALPTGRETLTWYLFLHAAFSAERNLSSSVVQLK